MEFKKLMKKTLPVILSLGLNFISPKYTETKQALIRENKQAPIEESHRNYYNQNWAGSVKVTNISIGADEEFIAKYGNSWKSQLENYIKGVSENYYSNFGIEFKIVEYIEWKSDDFSDYFSLVNDLEKIPVQGDFMVRFTKQKDYLILGVSGEKSALVEDSWEDCSVYVTIHELGHLFGLKHVSAQGSFMYKFSSFCHPRLSYWDEESREKMLENK